MAESVSAAFNERRNFSLTADVPFFLVHIDSNSHATIKHLEDWETSQTANDAHKRTNAPTKDVKAALIDSNWDIGCLEGIEEEREGFGVEKVISDGYQGLAVSGMRTYLSILCQCIFSLLLSSKSHHSLWS